MTKLWKMLILFVLCIRCTGPDSVAVDPGRLDENPMPASSVPISKPGSPYAAAAQSFACPGGLGINGSDHAVALFSGTVPGKSGRGVRVLGDTTIVAGIENAVQFRHFRTGVIKNSYDFGSGMTCYDLDASGNRVAAVWSGGVTVMDLAATKLWQTAAIHGTQPSSSSRVAIGTGGQVVALAPGGSVEVFGPAGERLTSFKVPNAVQDVAISSEKGMLYVCGYTQITSVLQIPWIFAYDFSGTRKWVAYNQTISGLGADTRCTAIFVSANGMLYFAGEQAGGGSPYDRDAQDITKTVSNGGMGPDMYQKPMNLNGAAHIGYIGCLDATTGAWLNGTHFLTRLSSGKGNALKPSDIFVDDQERIFVTGSQASSIANVGQVTINGKFMPGAGTFFAVFDKAFCRQLWITLASDGSGLSVAAAKNTAAILSSSATNAVITAGADTAGLYCAIVPLGIPGGNTSVLW